MYGALGEANPLEQDRQRRRGSLAGLIDTELATAHRGELRGDFKIGPLFRSSSGSGQTQRILFFFAFTEGRTVLK